ncbi:hypothetical protein, partial [Sulfitobacter sp.]|uniref:hypothetical protein n=1 Tax=Sulfitobacter sp. TaxID=1903071 RepID=UPI003002D9C5
MILPILLLGGFGILMASLTDGLDNEESDLEGDETQAFGDLNEELVEPLTVDFDPVVGTQPFPEMTGSDVDAQVESIVHDGFESETPSLADVSEDCVNDGTQLTGINVFTLDFESAVFSNTTAPLEDFNARAPRFLSIFVAAQQCVWR